MLRTSCSVGNCPNVSEPNSKYCVGHRPLKNKEKRVKNQIYDYTWKKYAADYRVKHPLCVKCLESDRVSETKVVDHIIPHKGDMKLFWDKKNHQALCKKCHDIKTASEGAFGSIYRPTYLQKSAIPLYIVCGSPGSGKTTYAIDRAGANDIVIDLDIIKQKLFNCKPHEINNTYTKKAIIERNKILAELHNKTSGKAYFVISGAKKKDREFWQQQLGGEIVIVDSQKITCLKRVQERAQTEAEKVVFTKAVEKWWREYD